MSLTWINIRDVHAADLAEHATRAQALGLDCPLDVFEQLFHEHHDDAEIAGLLRFLNWEQSLGGGRALRVALRHTGVPRPYQRAVDEARVAESGRLVSGLVCDLGRHPGRLAAAP